MPNQYEYVCPECGQDSDFCVHGARVEYLITEEPGEEEFGSSPEWDGDTIIECLDCRHLAPERTFVPGADASIALTATSRGFLRGEFVDAYNVACSIQESSLAEESCIWLGCNEPRPRRCVGNKWEAVELPEGTVCDTRMHLSQRQARLLLPLLEHFAQYGNLRDRKENAHGDVD